MTNKIIEAIQNCEHSDSSYQVSYGIKIDGKYKYYENGLCIDCLKLIMVNFNDFVNDLEYFEIKINPQK
jgi:hypothetical protein